MLVAVYWKPKSAALNEAAALLLHGCNALAKAGYVSLRHKRRTRKNAEAIAFTPSEEGAIDLLLRGVNRKDIGGTPIRELGFSFGLWSGGSEERAYEFSGQIGNATNIGTNNLLLRLPSTGPLSYEQNEQSVLALFHDLVALTQADQGVICDASAIAWEGRKLAPTIPSRARHPNEA